MWVRAVAMAVAVFGWMAAAQAGERYTEVWNPPEAMHASKRAKAQAPVSRKVAAAKTGKSKGTVQKVGAKKASPLHLAGKAKSARSALKVAAKPAPRHVEVAQSPSHFKAGGNGKALAQAKVAHPKAPKLAAAKPAALQAAPTVASDTSKPLTDSANLPPILH